LLRVPWNGDVFMVRPYIKIAVAGTG